MFNLSDFMILKIKSIEFSEMYILNLTINIYIIMYRYNIYILKALCFFYLILISEKK